MAQNQSRNRRTSLRRRRSNNGDDIERRIRVEQRHGVGRRVQKRRVSEILVVIDRRGSAQRRSHEQRRSGVNRRETARRASYDRRGSGQPQSGDQLGEYGEDPAT